MLKKEGVALEFTGFLGNSHLKQRLSAAFRTGRSTHCYLLCGPEGSGKRTLAGILAAALQCEAEEVPCGRCLPCRKALSGNHPDIITIDDPEKKTVSVELIRQLQTDAYIRPNEGRHKVYLIPRAQDMTESAQNALLKLIEEPPAYAVFLLLATTAEKLLPTVRSRCAELRLEPVPLEDALHWLTARFPDRDRDTLHAAWLRTGGYLGQTEALLRGSLYLPQTLEFARAFAEKSTMDMAMVLSGMEKLPRHQLLELLIQWRQLLTDAMLVRTGLPAAPEATAIGRSRTGADLAAAVQALQKAQDACTANIGSGHICGWLLSALIA